MSDLVKNPFGDHTDPEVPTATLQIYRFIDEYLGRKEHSTDVNRASAATMCFKRRWFQRKGFEGESLTPRKLVNFTLGDLSEHTVKYFIEQGCVGPGKLYSEVDFGKVVGEFTIQNGKVIKLYAQEDLTAQIGPFTVTAHVDGWGKRNSDGKWELIEVKSAADYGFEDFKTSGPGDYLKQAHVCMQTGKAKELGVREVRYYYLKKNTGHLYDRLFPFDESLAQDVEQEFIASNQEQEPKAPHVPTNETFRGKPTGRKILPWQCNYCSYTTQCHTDAQLEFKNGKPIYVIQPKKESA